MGSPSWASIESRLGCCLETTPRCGYSRSSDSLKRGRDETTCTPKGAFTASGGSPCSRPTSRITPRRSDPSATTALSCLSGCIRAVGRSGASRTCVQAPPLPSAGPSDKQQRVTAALPPIPTHVMGSHGFPGWFWTALDKIKAGDYGQTDMKETFDDATQLAIRDQERAGIDIVCDGEMRRFFFVQTFYAKMDGLEPVEPLRKTGLYAYDSTPRYRPLQRIKVPSGLGVVEEFRYLKTQTDRPVKATCPGPVTLSIHVQLRPGDAYGNDRLALCWDFVPAINAELRALVDAGADWIQIDEPSAAIVPGQIGEYVKMFNACVEGVKAKIGYHVCFGNLLSRPRGKRSYRWMFPHLLDCRCDQFVFEYANREMAEIEMWKEIGVDLEVGCGVVDVKSFYMETPEDVAERVRLLLASIPAERLSLVPDCGFFPVPRWVAFEKLKRLAAGARLARADLRG